MMSNPSPAASPMFADYSRTDFWFDLSVLDDVAFGFVDRMMNGMAESFIRPSYNPFTPPSFDAFVAYRLNEPHGAYDAYGLKHGICGKRPSGCDSGLRWYV